jgi:hypothetical protein
LAAWHVQGGPTATDGEDFVTDGGRIISLDEDENMAVSDKQPDN